MKEEEIIKKYDNGNPFRVPEGYFEGFTEELMQKLPEAAPKEKTVTVSIWQRMKPWMYMAAMFAGLIGSAKLFLGTPADEASQSEMNFLSNNEMIITEESIDSLVEYAIIDEYLLYRYLTDIE